MARAPNPKIVEAKKLFDDGMPLVDIAKKMEVPAGTVRRWKHDHDWDNKSKKKQSERSDKKKSSKANVRKPKGAPKGNKNAAGAGAPKKNTNAEKHGAYTKIYWDTLDEDELGMVEGMPQDEESLLLGQIQLFSVRERRIMQSINKYRNSKEPIAISFTNRSETKRAFKDAEEEAEYNSRQQEKIDKKEILPGRVYSTTTGTENKDNIIARLESELSNVQAKKTRAIEALAKLHLEKQKLDGENKGNELVKTWAEKVMQTRRDSNGE